MTHGAKVILAGGLLLAVGLAEGSIAMLVIAGLVFAAILLAG